MSETLNPTPVEPDAGGQQVAGESGRQRAEARAAARRQTASTPPSAVEPDLESNPWGDPEAAKAEIERLRRENGAARTNAKATAAEEAKKELAAQLSKILGGDDDTDDPTKLAEKLTASQAETRHTNLKLAVFQTAAAANGDPAALLDSTSFLKSLDGVDPTDTAAVQAAITAAVTANSRLGVAPADPRNPAPNPAQGSSANGVPDLTAQIAEATKAGNHALAISLKRQLAAPKTN